MVSELVTKNDLTAILNEVLPSGSGISGGGSGGGSSSSSYIPTANVDARFDTAAQLNSTDMTSQELNSFVSSLTAERSNLIDLFYPVGSYYETSDINFDPNVSWSGTWVLDSNGKVTVGYDSSQTEFNSMGKTGGAKTHTLVINEIPTHTHGIIQASSGTGTAIVPNANSTTPTSGTYLINAYDAGAGWIPSGSQYVGTGAWNANTKGAGGGAAHNNLQPYVVVNRWHRTA